MQLAISNIAWEVAEDEQVAALLNRYAIDAIDIAPGKYFPDPLAATSTEISRVRDWWAQRGIAINGMQGLLFCSSGLNLFGSAQTQSAMLAYLDGICRIAGGLGATKLVFGAPKHRDRSGLSDAQANRVAVDFFLRLGEMASQHGVMFCLEAVAACNGANFMMTHAETAGIVNAVGHSAIRMLLDSGAIAANNEGYAKVIRDHAALIAHVHLSEPGLVTLGDGGTDHAALAALMRECLPGQMAAVEMFPARNEPNPDALERAIKFAIHHYRNGCGFELPA